MSRSYKNYPHIGFSDSEKFDKRYTHKRLRSKCKQLLNKRNIDGDNGLTKIDLPVRDEIKDHWDYAKDGGVDLEPRDRDLFNVHFNKNGKLRK